MTEYLVDENLDRSMLIKYHADEKEEVRLLDG